MKKSDYITLRIKPEVKEKLQLIADKEDRTLSYVANRIIENYLKEEEKTSGNEPEV